jgi:hypothetical protein
MNTDNTRFLNASARGRQKPAFIEAAEEESKRLKFAIGIRSVSLRELDALIGRTSTDALVRACGGFHLPVPSPGQKCELAEAIVCLIGKDAAKTLIHAYANVSIYIPAGRA